MEPINKNVVLSKSRFLGLAVAALAAGLTKPAVAAGAAAEPELNDARIVRSVLSFDQSEARLASSVAGKLSSPGARNLAQRVRTDMAEIDRTLGALVTVAPAEAAENERGEADALSTLSGDALDRAYLDREVKSHETMLARLDRQLIPNASEPLQRWLIDLSSELAAQMRYARDVQQAQWFTDTAAEERADISREISNSGP